MKTTTNFTQTLATVIVRQNGTPTGLAALQASLLREKEGK